MKARILNEKGISECYRGVECDIKISEANIGEMFVFYIPTMDREPRGWIKSAELIEEIYPGDSVIYYVGNTKCRGVIQTFRNTLEGINQPDIQVITNDIVLSVPWGRWELV